MLRDILFDARCAKDFPMGKSFVHDMTKKFTGPTTYIGTRTNDSPQGTMCLHTRTNNSPQGIKDKLTRNDIPPW